MWPRRKFHGLLLLVFGLGILLGTVISSTLFAVLLGLVLFGCGCACIGRRR